VTKATELGGKWFDGGFAIGALSLIVAVAIGWFAGRGTPPLFYTVIPVAALIALFFATRPTLLLWAAVYGGLVVSGLTKLYLPQVQQIRWVLAPIAVLLVLHALAASLGQHTKQVPRRMPSVIWWALAFMLAVILASITNDFEAKRLVIGIKGYFQVWGLLFVLAFFPWPVTVIDRLPKVFVGIGLLQFPFVLHQLLVLVPARVGMGDGIVPIDIVAGTFGASLEGGGANAVLNAFQVIVFAGLIAARQLGLISLSRLLVLSVPLLFPVMVNEAKVSIFYLLAAFLVLYGNNLVQRPLRFVAATLFAALLCVLLLVVFTVNAPENARVKSWQDLVRFTYEYNVAKKEVGGKFSRGGALEFWVDRHGFDDFKETLFGHGVGYTRVADADSSFGKTAKSMIGDIPFEIDLEKNIGNTAIAAVLWETGVLGLFCVFGLLAATFRSAGRLEQIYASNRVRVASFRAIRTAAVIIFITLWHKDVFVFDVAYQTLLMLLIGFVAYWDRQTDGTPDTTVFDAAQPHPN
jgi:hypothetical protein